MGLKDLDFLTYAYLGFSFLQASTRLLMLWLSMRSLMMISALQLQHFLVLFPPRMKPSTSSSTAHDLQTSRPQQGITCGFEKGNWHTWQRSAAGHGSGASFGGGAVRPGNGPAAIGSVFPDPTDNDDKGGGDFGIICNLMC